MRKSSTKYEQIKSNNVWKELCTISKWNLSQASKAGSHLKASLIKHYINRLKKSDRAVVSVEEERAVIKACDKSSQQTRDSEVPPQPEERPQRLTLTSH